MLESLGQTMVRRGVRRNPEREASDNEELRILQRAIARLQPKQRAAFVLVELEEMTSEEAAKALDVPAGTVRTRLFKARRALRAALDPARFK
jgi:RNA polymerase sigma-70 factor (ECF subfamily)